MAQTEILNKIKKNLKTNQILVDINYEQTGEDELVIPIFKIVYKNPPQNFRLVKMIEPLKVAILETLDYVEVGDATK